jgi:hypothetical protein
MDAYVGRPLSTPRLSRWVCRATALHGKQRSLRDAAWAGEGVFERLALDTGSALLQFPHQPALDCERLVSPSRTTSIADLDLRGALSWPIASLATRTCSATFPVRSASAPMFFAAPPRLFVGRPKLLLFLLRVRAIPAATPASPVPMAIAGVLSFLATDVTALPAVFAPLAVAAFAASTAPFLFDELALVRPDDVLGRVLRCEVLAFCERLALERDFAPVRPVAEELRPFDRLPDLALDMRLVC